MKSIGRFCWVVTLMIFSLSMLHATAYFVNAATGNDSNNGTSSGTAFKTITKALSVVIDGDVINVAAGTYNTALGEVFPLEMVSGVTLTGTSGALTTIVDASGAMERVMNCTGNSSTTTVQGFTMTGGHVTASSNGSNTVGGGISFTGGDQTIFQNNIVTRDTARGYNFNEVTNGHNGGNSYGGGIYVASAAPTIRNNVISHNVAIGGGGENWQGGFSGTPSAGGFAVGGGMAAAFANAMTAVNNTFYGNKALGGPGGVTNNGEDDPAPGGNATAGGLDAGFNVTAFNNIFVNNSAVGGPTGGSALPGTSTDGAISAGQASQVSYNLYFENAAETNPNGGILGTNNVVGNDPLLVSADDYHLTSTSSPAYHAGTPTGAPSIDLDGTARSVTTPTIGAFEGTDPLPVEMTNMSVTSHGLSATIRWSTATEVDNAGWEVERRAIANLDLSTSLEAGLPIANYQTIAFVEGAGTSSSPREYIFTDDISQFPIRNSQYRLAYRLKQLDRSGSFSYSHEVEVEIGTAPREFTLGQNYPNPFNPATVISFTVAGPSGAEGQTTSEAAKLFVYDIRGREIARLFEGFVSSGQVNRVSFDAKGLPSGLYFYRLDAGKRSAVRKMTLLK